MQGIVPRKVLEITVAITAESTTDEKFRIPYSPRIISRAKNIPASGALKVAAIPPAAPQAIRILVLSSGSFNSCPSVDPRAELICTIGPSLPTDPPEPIHMDEARAFIAATPGPDLAFSLCHCQHNFWNAMPF